MSNKKLKKVTCPWTLVVDTREQTPWSFDSLRFQTRHKREQIIIPKVRKKLDQGDYSILGMEHLVSIERKSAPDLCGTLGRGRARFIRELTRLNELKWSCVIIEAEWLSMLRDMPPRSKITPQSVNGTIVSFMQRFPKTHWMWCHDSVTAARQAYKVLNQFWKDNQYE